MTSEGFDSMSTYDMPLRHSRTLSRPSSQTEELLPHYPHSAPVSNRTSTETLRAPNQPTEQEQKELDEGGLGVDGFVHEIERVQYDLSTTKLGLERLSTLYDRALAVPSSTSSRCAVTNKLHADLDETQNTVRATFAPLPPVLRTLLARVTYLRGGGGRAFVLASETGDNKARIVGTARRMKECVALIEAGLARGARVESAERKSGSTTNRKVENPFQEIKKAYIDEAGPEGMSFLDRIDTTIKPTTSYASWLSPLAYSLPSYSLSGHSDDKNDDQDDVPLLKDDEEAKFEKLGAELRPFSKVRVWLILLGVLVITASLTAEMIVWTKHGDHPTAS